MKFSCWSNTRNTFAFQTLTSRLDSNVYSGCKTLMMTFNIGESTTSVKCCKCCRRLQMLQEIANSCNISFQAKSPVTPPVQQLLHDGEKYICEKCEKIFIQKSCPVKFGLKGDVTGDYKSPVTSPVTSPAWQFSCNISCTVQKITI